MDTLMLSGWFMKLNRPLLSKAVTLFALVLLCGSMAQLILRVLDYLAPPMPAVSASVAGPDTNNLPAYNIGNIQAASLFGEEVLAETPEVVEKSTLNIRVNGLVLSDVQEKSLAFLNFDGREGVYRKGDAFNEDSEVLLESVQPDRVIIRYRGQLQEVAYQRRTVDISALTAGLAGSSSGTGHATSQQLSGVRNELKANPAMISRYMSVIPYKQNGRVIGFKIKPGQDAWLFRELGFKPDDILLSINELPLFAGENLPKLSNILATADSIDLEIERGGELIHKKITF